MAQKNENNSDTQQEQKSSSNADVNRVGSGSFDTSAVQSAKPPITIDQPLDSSKTNTEQKTKSSKKNTSANTRTSTNSKNNSQNSTSNANQSSSAKIDSKSSKSQRKSWFPRFIRYLIVVLIGVILVLGAGVALLNYSERFSLSGFIDQTIENNDAVQRFTSRISELELRQNQLELEVSELSENFSIESLDSVMHLIEEIFTAIEIINRTISLIDTPPINEFSKDELPIYTSRPDLEYRISELEKLVDANNESRKSLESLVLAQSNALESIQTQVSSATSQNVSMQTLLTNITLQIEFIDQQVLNFETKINDLAVKLENNEIAIEENKTNEQVANLIAASALKDAVLAGQPFESELVLVSNLTSNETEILLLSKYARSGLPTNTQLVQQFPPIAQAMNSASVLADSSDGVIGKVVASVKSRVVIRRSDDEGIADSSSQIGKMAELVSAERFGDALAIYDTLPESVQEPAGEWVNLVSAKIAANNLVNQIFQDVDEALEASKN